VRPSYRDLLSLAWPIVISRASQVVVGVTDAWMVASLGTVALAAVTTGAMNVFTVLILPMGVTFIVSSFSSQLCGKGDLSGARRFGWYGLILAGGTLVLCALVYPLVESIVSLMPYEPAVARSLSLYVRIRLLSGGAAIGMEALANYYGGLGNTRLPMFANLAAMLLNVVGNWILIGGHLGVPAMGVAGAAWASVIATTLAFCALLVVFLRDTGTAKAGALRMSEFLRMLRFGVPSGLNWFLEFLAFMFFVNIVVAGLGTTALAGMMAVMQINSVSFMPAFAMASAGAILVGQTIGKGDKDSVGRIVRMTFTLTGTYQGAVGLLYLLLPGVLFAPFVTDNVDGAKLFSVGTRLLMLSAAWQLCDAAATALSEALRATGDTAFTLWVRLAVAWFVFVPGAYFSTRYLHWTEAGAVSWIVIYLSLIALVLFMRFRGGAWRRLQLTEPSL